MVINGVWCGIALGGWMVTPQMEVSLMATGGD